MDSMSFQIKNFVLRSLQERSGTPSRGTSRSPGWNPLGTAPGSAAAVDAASSRRDQTAAVPAMSQVGGEGDPKQRAQRASSGVEGGGGGRLRAGEGGDAAPEDRSTGNMGGGGKVLSVLSPAFKSLIQ